MKKIFLVFFQALLILTLLTGCTSAKNSQLDSSTPSQSKSPTESNDKNKIPSLPEFSYDGNPIELPDDEFED